MREERTTNSGKKWYQYFVKCVKCKKWHNKQTKNKTGLCFNCYKKQIPQGKNHFNWKKTKRRIEVKKHQNLNGKVSYKYFGKCTKCKKNLSLNDKQDKHKVCRFCLTRGKPKCIDCGKQKKHYDSGLRCKTCNGLFYRGENRWNWKGGTTPYRTQIWNSREYKDWRITVFERDNYVCQKCQHKGKELRAHHIINFADHPSLRLNIDNGITLCKNCHIDFHRIYGKTNNNFNQLQQFLNEKEIRFEVSYL